MKLRNLPVLAFVLITTITAVGQQRAADAPRVFTTDDYARAEKFIRLQHCTAGVPRWRAAELVSG